jgi:hypothetical protein
MAGHVSQVFENIGDRAFYGCAALQTLNLPEGFGKATPSIWEGQTSIEALLSRITIGQRAFANTGLTSLTLPSTLQSIGSGAFYGCSDLKTINFAQLDLERGLAILDEAFAESGVTSLAFPMSPNGPIAITSRAFQLCDDLTEVTFQLPNPWNEDWKNLVIWGALPGHPTAGAFAKCEALVVVSFGNSACYPPASVDVRTGAFEDSLVSVAEC